MLIGFFCTSEGKDKTFKECFECARIGDNPCQMTGATLRGIKKSNTSYRGVDPGMVSVSQLNGCLRETYFKGGFDYTAPPERLYWMYRGTIAHYLMEINPEPGAIVENRFWREWKGIKLSGQVDVLIPDQNLIQDYKSCSQISGKGGLKERTLREGKGKTAKYDHSQQVNLYRWLVEPFFNINKMELVYIDMKEIWRVPAARMGTNWIEKILDERLVTLSKAYETGIAPRLEDAPWVTKTTFMFCKYCPVRHLCGKD